MLRKKLSILLILSILLTGCGLDAPSIENSIGPVRMVRRIEIASHPSDPDFDRCYVTQENMNALLAILRNLSTGEEPEQTPDLEGGRNYYTASVTFANGEHSVYYLLSHTYMRQDEDDWTLIDPERSEDFVRFLLDHPSDDLPAE